MSLDSKSVLKLERLYRLGMYLGCVHKVPRLNDQCQDLQREKERARKA